VPKTRRNRLEREKANAGQTPRSVTFFDFRSLGCCGVFFVKKKEIVSKVEGTIIQRRP